MQSRTRHHADSSPRVPRAGRTGRALAVSVAAIALLAAACSDNKSESTTTAATTEAPVTTEAPDTTAAGATTTVDAGLEAKLLTAAEVGAAWVPGEPINEMDLTMNADLCTGVVLDAAMAKRLNGQVGVQFSPANKASRHLMVQILAGEPTQLASDLDAYFAAMRTCPVDAAGGEGKFLSIDDIAVPEIGDQRHGLAIKAQESDGGAVWFVRVVQVRVGGTAVGLGLTEVLSSPTASPEISDADLLALVTKAVEKLSA